MRFRLYSPFSRSQDHRRSCVVVDAKNQIERNQNDNCYGNYLSGCESWDWTTERTFKIAISNEGTSVYVCYRHSDRSITIMKRSTIDVNMETCCTRHGDDLPLFRSKEEAGWENNNRSRKGDFSYVRETLPQVLRIISKRKKMSNLSDRNWIVIVACHMLK